MSKGERWLEVRKETERGIAHIRLLPITTSPHSLSFGHSSSCRFYHIYLFHEKESSKNILHSAHPLQPGAIERQWGQM